MAVHLRGIPAPSDNDSPPLFLYVISTNLVLDIEGDARENGKVIVSQSSKKDKSQQWVMEESGFISSVADRNLVLDCVSQVEGSRVVVARRKDDLHNWNQQWEYHRGYIRSMKNHNLVLDIEYRHSNPGANVIVYKPHKSGNHENQLWGCRLVKEGTGYSPRSPTKEQPKPRLFDPSKIDTRLTKLWTKGATFGTQTTPEIIFYNEIVSDRYCLINGMQVLRDEIQLAFDKGGELMSCAIDLTLPTVMTCLAHTNCGDRINNPFHGSYNSVVASRFANIARNGELMTENFTPAGGGTDDGGVLAYVTVGHQLDKNIRNKIYDGNKTSYILVNIDLMTHVGSDDVAQVPIKFGEARESIFRDSRSACGAIIATIRGYDEDNAVHRRLRKNLGETNFTKLRDEGVKTTDGVDITYVVAAAIVAIQGLYETCLALTGGLLDERSVAHVTASTTINGTDNMLYFARATVFGGEWKIQGFGLEANKYSGSIKQGADGKRRLVLTYDGKQGDQLEIQTNEYTQEQKKY